MKLTNREVHAARVPLGKLGQEKFPVQISHGIYQIAHALDPQLKVIEDTRQGLIKKYGGSLKDNPNIFEVKPDAKNYQDFIKELNELFDLEVDIEVTPVILPLKVASTCDQCHHNMSRDLEIEPAMFALLEKFIKVKE